MQWAMHSSSRSIASEEDKSRPDIISVVMENKATCSSNEWVLVDTPVFGDFFVVYKNWTLDLSKESADDEPEERPAIPEPEERPATLTPEPEERPPTPEPEERPATLTPEPEERPATPEPEERPPTPEPEERPPTPEPEERPPTPEPEERPPTPKPEERPAIPEPEERPASPAVETVDKFIYRRARENNARLTSEISLIPLHVAVYLFQNNLIGIDQYNYARNNYQEESDKATRLANVIFTCDLSRHFRAVLTAFDEAGVETMTEIAAEARDLYPDAFLPSSDPETLLSQKNRNFKFDEQLEEKIKQVSADGDGGPTAAIGYINELVHPKERELLLHKACHDTTDLNTFNIVLLSTTEAGLINYSDERVNQRTPLHVACACLPDTRDDIKTKQQVSKITDLLKRDAKATLQDIDGNTPLHLAALRNNPQTVSLILTLDPDSRNIVNNLGNTALHIASKKNFVEVAQALLTYAHKANACISNKTKIRTPLHQAVSRGHSMMAGMILDYEPRSVECLDKKGMSPLLLAAKRGHLQIIKRLVKKPLCPVFVIDNEGRTPLHYACAWGNYDLVDFLLKENGSRDFIDHKDNKGETALHIAGRHGDTKVWKLLRSKNASKVVVNDFGETPKEVAANAGHSLSRRRTIKGVSKPIPIPTVSANTYVQPSDESYLDETV